MHAVNRLASRRGLLGLAVLGVGWVVGLVLGTGSADASGCFR